MADKKFSELETASEIKNGDFLALSQDTGNGKVSLKATIIALATKMLTAINFTSALTTTDKTVIGAINEIAEGGGGGGTDVIADDFDSTATYAVGDYCIYDGKLYKCTTAVSTAGDWDSSDWTETLVMDEVEQGGGGGGGGGHTIKDDSGNALTQRSNLQFKGVYTHDNSNGNASVVEVAREMTWAEYQQLSADEKKGLITITDVFTNDSGGYSETNLINSPVNLATSKTKISLNVDFTDYDAIYIDFMPQDSGSNMYENCVIRLVSDITLNKEYVGFSIYDSRNYGCVYEFTDSTTIKANSISGSALMKINKVVGLKFGLTAGGTSLPDYSTTEHKTGRKWIDGKDIWECTFELTSPLSLNPTGFTTSSIDASNMETCVNVTTLSSNGDLYSGVITAVVNNYLAFAHWWNGISIKTVTVQYTKAS